MPFANGTEALHTVTITIPDDLSVQLAPYHDQLDILLRVGLREVKMQQSLALFQKGTLSLWKAARLAGVSLREMVQYAVSQGVRAPVDEATLQEELAAALSEAAALPEAAMLPEVAASSEA
jgi:predicted HTH domain antitoxin